MNVGRSNQESHAIANDDAQRYEIRRERVADSLYPCFAQVLQTSNAMQGKERRVWFAAGHSEAGLVATGNHDRNPASIE